MALKKPKTIKAGCAQCEATGFHGDDPVAANNPFCPACKGAGTVHIPAADAADCPACQGRGHVEHVPCPPCGHTGKVTPAAPEPPAEVDSHQAALIEGLQIDIATLRENIERRDTKIADLKDQIKTLKAAAKENAAPPAPAT